MQDQRLVIVVKTPPCVQRRTLHKVKRPFRPLRAEEQQRILLPGLASPPPRPAPQAGRETPSFAESQKQQDLRPQDARLVAGQRASIALQGRRATVRRRCACSANCVPISQRAISGLAKSGQGFWQSERIGAGATAGADAPRRTSGQSSLASSRQATFCPMKAFSAREAERQMQAE
jgi:hypothetical protein